MINNEINAIKDRICMTIMPKRIYLFGSFAKDTYNEDSVKWSLCQGQNSDS